jgi:DNA-binding transcriptional LysR family regulator
VHVRQLAAFIAVAEELNFSRAARRLNVSQQPLSFTIKRLEAELGVSLFKRSTRKVELTDAGKAFLEEAHAAQAHLNAGIDAAKRAAKGQFGRLTIGYVNTSLFNLMPKTLRRFRERYPGVALTLHELNSEGLEKAVSNGVIQAAFLHPEFFFPEVNYDLLLREPMVVALPKGHKLERRRQLRVTDLTNETFVGYARDKNHVNPDPVFVICRSGGFLPNIVQKAETSMAVVGLVSVGIGVSIVPYCMTSIRKDEVTYLPLVDPTVNFDFVLAVKKTELSVEAAALREVAREVAAELTSSRGGEYRRTA